MVISKKGSGIRESFTVRRISYGEGVEKTFPLHSPKVDKITVSRKGKVKKAKLYYLRKKIGKKSKIESVDIFKGNIAGGSQAPGEETENSSAEKTGNSQDI